MCVHLWVCVTSLGSLLQPLRIKGVPEAHSGGREETGRRRREGLEEEGKRRELEWEEGWKETLGTEAVGDRVGEGGEGQGQEENGWERKEGRLGEGKREVSGD